MTIMDHQVELHYLEMSTANPAGLAQLLYTSRHDTHPSWHTTQTRQLSSPYHYLGSSTFIPIDDRYPQRSRCQHAQGVAPVHGACQHSHPWHMKQEAIRGHRKAAEESVTKPADHVETPGFLHILQRVMTARSPQRRLAQTSTNKGPSALFGKREGDHSLTWMTYCMTSLLHGGDRQTLHMPKLQRPRNNNCYICQFYRCLHTQLGRSLKWNLSFFKKKKMLAKKQETSFSHFHYRTMQVIILS